MKICSREKWIGLIKLFYPIHSTQEVCTRERTNDQRRKRKKKKNSKQNRKGQQQRHSFPSLSFHFPFFPPLSDAFCSVQSMFCCCSRLKRHSGHQAKAQRWREEESSPSSHPTTCSVISLAGKLHSRRTASFFLAGFRWAPAIKEVPFRSSWPVH